MIPVIEGVYSFIDLSLNDELSKDEHDWRVLTYKKYMFCKNIRDGIQRSAEKVQNKCLFVYCNFSFLIDKFVLHTTFEHSGD